MKSTDRRNKRGADLSDLEVTFTATAERTAWRALAAELSTPPTSFDNEDGFSFGFVALPKEVKRGGIYITVNAHSEKNSETELHWHLHWRTIPSDDPPSTLISDSERVGGYPKALNRLIAKWPGTVSNLDAKVTATYKLEPSQYKRLPGGLGASPKSIRLSGDTSQHKLQPKLRMTMWQIEPKVGHVIGLTTIHAEKQKSIMVEARLALDLSAELLTSIDQVIWVDVAALIGAP